jgi:hypothetical protein
MFPLGARKVSQFQAPSDSGSPSSSSPLGQLGARLIQVHLERLDNAGVHLKTQGLAEEPDSGCIVPAGMPALPDRTFGSA